MAIKAVLALHHELKTKYNFPYLLCSKITQDYLEAFFGIIRRMGVLHTRPSALNFNYRVCNYIKEKLLEDSEFDIFSLEAVLQGV